MLICIFTGFSSGLPLYVLISLLPAWLRSEQVDLKSIGLFALIQLPFTWKFLWSPLMDRYALPFFGRRRGWILVTQILLAASLPLFGWLRPAPDLWTIAYLATAVAFFSASQDIVLDAFRREILPEAELGLGNSIHINAYRVASLVPGSLALILADHFPWQVVFIVVALFMLPGIAMTLVVAEPATARGAPRTLQAAIVEPVREFLQRAGLAQALYVLAFVFLYKLGDSMASALATPFYLDMGYSKTDIGLIAKNVGLWATVIGGLAGGIWMVNTGINRALWLFGFAQMVTNLGFAWLAQLGAPDRVALGVVIGCEALGAGLGTAALVAYIARSTDPRYTATQLALFTSLTAVPRTVVNATTGWIVEAMGWGPFFVLCTVLALPGLLLLLKVAPWHEAPARADATPPGGQGPSTAPASSAASPDTRSASSRSTSTIQRSP